MREVLKNLFPAERLAAVLFGLTLLLFPLPAASAAQGQSEAEAREQRETPRRPPPGLNLMRQLNLSREQRQRLREIRRQGEAELRAHTRRVRLARRALDEAIYADEVSDALVEERTAELSQALAALARLRAQTELRVRRVLTAEQLRSFRDLRQRARQRQRAQRRLDRRNRRQQPGPAGRPALRPEAPANTTPGQRPAPQPSEGRRP